MAKEPQLSRQPSGRHDFTIVNGNPVLTDDQTPQVLRLLRQGPWIGDDGERSGKDLDDIKFTSSTELEQAKAIIETRLGVLVRMRRLESISVTSVAARETAAGSELDFRVQVKNFGQLPTSGQIRVVK